MGGGGGRSGAPNFVHQKCSKAIVLFVNFIFSAAKSGSRGKGWGSLLLRVSAILIHPWGTPTRPRHVGGRQHFSAALCAPV